MFAGIFREKRFSIRKQGRRVRQIKAERLGWQRPGAPGFIKGSAA